MPLVIDLPPETEDAVRRAAEAAGMTLAAYVARRLLEAEGGIAGRALAARWDDLGAWGGWAHRDDIEDPLAYAQGLRRTAETRTGSNP